jgi:RHS repeat-associated protein
MKRLVCFFVLALAAMMALATVPRSGALTNITSVFANYDVGASAAGLTVEFWMKPAAQQDGSLLGWANGVRLERYWNNNHGDSLRCFLGSGGQYVQVANVLGGEPYSWTHVAVTYDRTSGQAKISINGVVQGTASVGTNLLTTARDFYLGQVAPSTAYYPGQLDEVSLYTRPLSTAEIQSIYSAGSAGKCITPPNQPPVVMAGGNRTVYLPATTITLHGTVYDDGLPGNTLAAAWNYLAGPGSIIFGSPNQPVTTVTFTNTGVYTFELSASDGQYSRTNTATVTVLPDPRIPPAVAINGPLDGTRIRVHAAGTNLTLSATVTDPDDGIGSVQFFQNGAPLSALTNGPYSVTVNNLLPGNYAFTAVATDFSGLSTTSAPVNVTLYVGANPPAIAFASPLNGSAYEVPANGVTNLVLNASASDSDGQVVRVDFFQNGTSIATFTNTPYTLGVSNLPIGVYSFTAVATDDDGLTHTSAPVTATVFVDNGPPAVAIYAPDDAAIVTAPTNIIGTANSSLLQSYQVRYRLAPPATNDDLPPTDSTGWSILASGSTPVVSNTLGRFDPTLLLNGIYQVQVAATDLKGRSGYSQIQTLLVDRNLKVGNFTISFNDLSVPVPGLPIQITRTYDSRAAASGLQGDFGAGWTMDIRNVRLQKNRSLSRNWNETVTGNPDEGDLSTAYHLDPGSPRIVTITFPDGRVEKFQFIPNPMDRALVTIDSPQWRFIPIGDTRGTLLPASYDEPDGNFLYFAGPIPGTADLYDFNFFWDYVGNFNTAVTVADLQRYPTLFRYTSAEGYKYLIDEIAGLQSVTDPNGNTLVIATNGLIWKNPIAGTNSVSVAFNRDQFGRITNIVDAAGNRMSYQYGTNNNLVTFIDRVGQTNGFAYTNAAFPHYLTSLTDARGVTPVQNQFDAAGRLVGNTDAFGNAIAYGHDLAHNREYVTNQLGFVTASDYDDHGNVTHTLAPDGGENFTTYDDAGNVLSVTDPLGHTTSYAYDAQDNRTSVTDPLGNITRFTYGDRRRVTSVTDPRGNSITNAFDSQGNLLSLRDPLGRMTRFAYDSNGQPVAMTNALGQSMTFEYDLLGRLAREKDALNHASDYSRDASGNLLQQTTTRTTPQGLQTLTVQFQYDAQSRLTNSIFPDGSSAQTIYNAIGKAAAVIDQQGRQTSMEYDALGRVTRTIYPDNFSDSSAFDAEGRRIASTNRIGQATRYEYDSLGRLIHTIYSDGTGLTNYFNLAGQLIVSTDANGNHTFYGYDAAGRTVAVTNALGQVSRSFYDASGNLTNSIDALGRSTTFVYDALNRRVQTVFADGTTQQTWFDELGRRTYEQDQAGKVTAFAYDTLGRLSAVTNALGYVTSYGYDELSQQISQTDANQHTTTFEYDSLGRRVRRTLPGNQVETYAYNIGGLLTNKTDFNGYTTTYQYDSMNRLLAKMPDARRSEPAITFGYNVLGLRTNMTDASGATAYGFDGRNRLIQKIKTWGGTGNLPIQLSNVLSYAYDGNGSLTNILSSSANGVNVGYEYDSLNRLSAVADANVGRTAYTYDGVGNLKGYTYPNLAHTEHAYDALNRLTNLGSSTLLTALANYAYTVGVAGNRLAATETVSPHGVPHTINRTYSYDDVYRLTGETISGAATGSLGYSYDPVGNRQNRSVLTLPLLPQTFSFDANDRLNTDNYDANGNTLLSAGFSQFQPDQYDFENRLVSRVATVNGSTTINILYDGDGNRVKKTVVTPTNSVTTFFVVDELNPSGYAQVLEEQVSLNSQPSALNCTYTYGHNLISRTGYPSTINPQPTTSFYGYDGHNNVRYLTDANGNVTDTYDYDAFGNLTAATGDTVNYYLFTGEQFDVDLGLYYLRARYHNPDTGRFWNMDSFEGNGSDPASLHKYTYANNNPVGNHDPSGHESLGEVMMGTAIGNMLGGALINAYGGAIGRLSEVLIGGGSWNDAANAALTGVDSDVESGMIGGLAGYGIGKAAFWAIGKATPWLLQNTPTFMMAFNRVSGRLNRAWQAAEAAWARLDQAIIQGSEASIESAAVALEQADSAIATLSKAYDELAPLAGFEGQAAEVGVPSALRAGQLAEGPALDAIGSSGKVVFTPTADQINSAAFKVIVGDARYTASGAPVSTIFDGSTAAGLAEIKSGSSMLNSSYQLRLQTYGALVNNQPLTIFTSRAVNPTFGDWLTRWGVPVKPMP